MTLRLETNLVKACKNKFHLDDEISVAKADSVAGGGTEHIHISTAI